MSRLTMLDVNTERAGFAALLPAVSEEDDGLNDLGPTVTLA